MKGKRQLLIGMILGVLISWALVFFSLPLMLRNVSFILGFIACLLLASLALLLWLVRDDPSFLKTLFGKKMATKDADNQSNVYFLIKQLLYVFILMGLWVSAFVLFKQHDFFKNQMRSEKEQIKHQAALLESVRMSNLVYLMSNILDKVDEELKDNPKRILTKETIARIAALSYSFKPYTALEGEQLSEKKLSPERGQLLLALSKMNMDSSSFNQIKWNATFENADLSGADLRGAQLSGAHLSGANLQEADMRGANLEEADLKKANLWGANLRNVKLAGADLKRADLKWAELRGADLKKVNFSGADLSVAKLNGVDLSGADLKWAFLDGAFLNEVNLAGVELSGSSMKRANLTAANLSRTDLKWVHFNEANLNRTNLSHSDLSGAFLSEADLTDANLTEANLYKVTVEEKNWFEKLEEWRVTGTNRLEDKYRIVEDELGVANYWILPHKKDWRY